MDYIQLGTLNVVSALIRFLEMEHSMGHIRRITSQAAGNEFVAKRSAANLASLSGLKIAAFTFSPKGLRILRLSA